MASFEESNLEKETELALTHLQHTIEFEHDEMSILLAVITETVQGMIARGCTADEVSLYLQAIFTRLQKDRNRQIGGYGGFAVNYAQLAA